MDEILSRVGQSAFNYAIKSSVPIVAAFTLKQCSRFVQQTPKGREQDQISLLQRRLESKIKIISPAIDMIELISARGNTSLESAVGLTRDIRLSIQELGERLSKAIETEELVNQREKNVRHRETDLHRVVNDMEFLLQKIDDAVPLINLAITTSGAALTSKLPSAVSTSRLLQASTFLTSADSKYACKPKVPVQVGPTFTVSLYMLFASHSTRPANDTGVRGTTWKEVMHKAQVKLVRLPLSDLRTPSKHQPYQARPKARTFQAAEAAAEYAYQLSIVEDLDDDRVHTFDNDGEQPKPFDGVKQAGIRELLPVHEIAKIFYADTGKILNIQGDNDENRPILLLKRDTQAEPPRRMQPSNEHDLSMENLVTSTAESSEKQQFLLSTPSKGSASCETSNPGRLPSGLDPEWMAFEVYGPSLREIEDDSDDTLDEDIPDQAVDKYGALFSAFSKLSLPLRSSPLPDQLSPGSEPRASLATALSVAPVVKTALSLLEMIIKLAALQQFRQETHLSIEDELLNLFLQDTSTTGHGEEKARRQRVRRDAVQRVGFDPYDESPIKMRKMSKHHDAADVCI